MRAERSSAPDDKSAAGPMFGSKQAGAALGSESGHPCAAFHSGQASELSKAAQLSTPDRRYARRLSSAPVSTPSLRLMCER